MQLIEALLACVSGCFYFIEMGDDASVFGCFCKIWVFLAACNGKLAYEDYESRTNLSS